MNRIKLFFNRIYIKFLIKKIKCKSNTLKQCVENEVKKIIFEKYPDNYDQIINSKRVNMIIDSLYIDKMKKIKDILSIYENELKERK